MSNTASATPAPPALLNLNPAYFSLVMATGIVSIACHLLGVPWLPTILLLINIVAYGLLWCLYLARAVSYPCAFLDDFTNHARGVGFFTIVAGTCVLGTQFVIVWPLPPLAVFLWLLGTGLYFVLIYSILAALIIKPQKPPFAQGLNGTWLVAVVATQGISLLGGQVYRHFPGSEQEILYFTLVLWLFGGMLYIWLIALIFYRYLFVPLEPAEFTPPYWIDMGAMAISTLAGDILMSNAAQVPLLGRLLPFIEGLTLLFWATATWWIPLLLLLGLWRHAVHRFPLHYDVGYWGMVFPLGMYTVCTAKLAAVADFPFLAVIPHGFVYIAVGAWVLVFTGMLQQIMRRSR